MPIRVLYIKEILAVIKKMPSRGRKFITEFLLPSLNEEKFGPRLMWLDIENKVFQMQWNHKSASDWTTSDAAVFAAWDQRKGHYKPDDKEYYPKSKQRFRAALYKFIKYKHITELRSDDKYTKIYCIGDGKNISGTYITATKSEKENDGNENSSLNVKLSPEDLILNWDSDSIWNVDPLTKSQGNSLVVYNNSEMDEDSYIKEEVITDDTVELYTDWLHSETSQNYIPSLNSSNCNTKNFSAKETSNVVKESDVKSLHVELHLMSNVWEKDNPVKRVVTIANDKIQNYFLTLMDQTRQMEWSNEVLDETDEKLSFDMSLAAYI